MKKIILSCLVAVLAMLPNVGKGIEYVTDGTLYYEVLQYVNRTELMLSEYGYKWPYGTIEANYSSLGPELIIPCYLQKSDGDGGEGELIPVVGIRRDALKTATNVVSIVIPETMERLDEFIFDDSRYNYELTSIVWNAKHATNSNAFYGVEDQITSFTFGDEVEYITNGVCSGMSNLMSITIPNSVTSIGKSAFSGCTGFTSISIPESVKNIGEFAFYNCRNIETITLESNVAEIGESAFEGCQSVYEIKCKATKTPNVYESTFEGISTSATLYVPEESIKKYKIHPVWSRFLDIQPLEESSEAVENTNQTNVVTNSKVLHDGRVVIVRDGEMYSILGEKIK